MTSYTKATNFASKDALITGNPLKLIKGTEIDDELNSIQVAVNSKADLQSPNFTGTPTAPTAAPFTNTTQIATCAFVLASGVPQGAIFLWSGSIETVPTGYALCNGSNGTPDLRDRFVVGAGNTYDVDDTGGSADSVVVSHTHTASSSVTDPGHKHTVQSQLINTGSIEGILDGTGGGGVRLNDTSTAQTGISVSTTVNSTGESGTNKNLPPYYALAYIMKT